MKENVDDSTTHVVCGASRRTLNVLYAITRGCWLVSQEWVSDPCAENLMAAVEF